MDKEEPDSYLGNTMKANESGVQPKKETAVGGAAEEEEEEEIQNQASLQRPSPELVSSATIMDEKRHMQRRGRSNHTRHLPTIGDGTKNVAAKKPDTTIYSEKQRIAFRGGQKTDSCESKIDALKVARESKIDALKAAYERFGLMEEKNRIAPASSSANQGPVMSNSEVEEEETTLSVKQRIAFRGGQTASSRKSKIVALETGIIGGTLTEYKNRIAGRRGTREAILLVSSSANQDPTMTGSNSDVEKEETILSEKQRIAGHGQQHKGVGPSRQPQPTHASGDGKLRDPLALFSSMHTSDNVDSHEGEKVVHEESDTLPDIEPGSVRVAGAGPERQGTIRIVSDPPEPVTVRSGIDGVLVHAHVVTGENNTHKDANVLATATPDPWWRRHQWWLAGGVVVVVGAIVLAVVLTTVQFGTPDTEAPSMAPTSDFEGIRRDTEQLIQFSLPPDAESRLSEPSSPQFAAKEWVVAQRLADESTYTDALVLQQYSLAVLYFGNGGQSSWIEKDGWLDSALTCDWYGVQCAPGDYEGDDTIIGLNMTGNGLNGTVSSDIAILQAQLQLLDLSDNDLSGSIPEELGRMTALTRLSLRENNIASRVPSSLGELTNLKHLDLSANAFSSTIPPEMGSLTLLDELRLEDNQLNGEIPSQIGLLTSLEHSNISGNRLSYALPSELGALRRLATLDVHGNSLLGPLPSEIGLLQNLKHLDISENYIFDQVPDSVHELSSLISLDVSSNLFTGSLPDFTRRLTQLSSLRAGDNFFQGNIRDVQFDDGEERRELLELDLSSNFLSSKIPSFLFYDFPSLQSLNISSNNIGGSIPSEIGLLTSLVALDLFGNDLTGSLPSELGRLSTMKSLNIDASSESYDTGITGSIPSEFGLMTRMTTCTMRNNSLNGTLPSEFGRLTKLNEISIYANGLSGSIPTEVGMLSTLQSMDFGFNDFTGTLPMQLGLLTNLEYFDLAYSTMVSGQLPSEIGSLTNLESLNLDMNMLSGQLPSEIGLLTKLEYLWLSSNKLSGQLPSETGLLTDLSSLRVRKNLLDGTIPSEFGLLTALTFCNLTWNRLGGSVPAEIGLMTSLEFLTVLNNQLNGSLPSELARLGALYWLDLSDNRLSGLFLLEEIGDILYLDISNTDISGSIPNAMCEAKVIDSRRVISVDCDKVACNCCDGCPTPSPTGPPLQGELPTRMTSDAPTASPRSPSSSHMTSNIPSASSPIIQGVGGGG